MRLTTILSAAAALVVAAALTITAAAPAQAANPDHHDHSGNVFALRVIDDAGPADMIATAAIDTTGVGIQQKGTTYPPDIDGQVPTYYGGTCGDGVLAYATWWSEGDWYIVYDKCEMDSLGAGPTDWDRVGAHEYAHTEGWGHYEEPAALNAAYEPGIVICHC